MLLGDLDYLDLDPYPDPSIIKQKSKKNLDFYWFVTFFMTFYL
jgi:hypothetical protein